MKAESIVRTSKTKQVKNADEVIALQSRAIKLYRHAISALHSYFYDRDAGKKLKNDIDDDTFNAIHELLWALLDLNFVCWPLTPILGDTLELKPEERTSLPARVEQIKREIDAIVCALKIKKTKQVCLQNAVTSWDSSQPIPESLMQYYFEKYSHAQPLSTKSICKTRRSRKKT